MRGFSPQFEGSTTKVLLIPWQDLWHSDRLVIYKIQWYALCLWWWKCGHMWQLLLWEYNAMQLSEVVMLFPCYKFAARSEGLYMLKLQHFKKPKCKESDASSLPGATPTVLWLCILCRIEMWGMGNESRLFLWWALVRKFQRSPCTFRGCSTHASRAHQTTPTYPYCRQGRKSFSSGCFRRQQWGNSWYQSWA